MSKTPTTRKSGINLDLSAISPSTFNRSPRTPTTASPKVQQIHTRLKAIIRRLVENYCTWQLGHEKGIRICNQLENIKLKLLDKANKVEGSSVFNEELSTWHERLQVVMEVLVDAIKNASDSVKQLRALEQLQQNDKDTVIGRTWRVGRFVAVADRLLKQFENEYQIKERVFREICHRTNQAQLIRCTVAWSYPRYVTNDTRFIIKCLTIECGLPDVDIEGNKERRS